MRAPLDELERLYADPGFHRMLIAADEISEERLAPVAAFAHARRLPLERFSIGVSQFVAADNGAGGVAKTAPRRKPPSVAEPTI